MQLVREVELDRRQLGPLLWGCRLGVDLGRSRGEGERLGVGVAAAAAEVVADAVATAAEAVHAAAAGCLERCVAQKRIQGYLNSNPGADASVLRGVRE